METPKLGVASIFNVQLYLVEHASTQNEYIETDADIVQKS